LTTHNNVSELDVVAANNSDLAGISILGTGLLSTADDSFRTAGSFLAKWWQDIGGVNTVAGTGDAITVTTSTIYGALKTGMRMQFVASAANTTAVTLNLDSLGAKALRKISGGTDVALVAGDIPGAKFRVDVAYDATANSAAGAWILLGSAPVAAATTSAAGIVQLATTTEALTGTNATKAVTPADMAQFTFGLAASVNTNALTVSLKNVNGDDPSSTNPATIWFRNSTLTTGQAVGRSATGSTSITVASTKTLGTASSNVPFRLWVVAVDTGSGLELGLVNALSGTSIMALRPGIYSPTATPGNSAQVIYTTSGQTSKPIAILGWMEWGSGLATAGTWASGPTTIKLWQPGDPLPGDVVQIARNATGTVATGSTALPFDNTIPQITEGDQYMSQAITPFAASDILRVTTSHEFANSANIQVVAALFRDSGANAVAAIASGGSQGQPLTSALGYAVQAGSASTTTFKLRAGGSSGTTTFNGQGGSASLGGVMASFIQVEEIMA
jgi:hypothetical protein